MEPNHIDQIKQTFQEKTANLPALTPEQEKQILHEIIQERIAVQPQQSSSSASSDDTETKEEAISAAPLKLPTASPTKPAAVPEHIQQTVQSLVDMAVKDDLYKATKMAYETKNPFLIDAYHDRLVNEFYQLIKLQEQES